MLINIIFKTLDSLRLKIAIYYRHNMKDLAGFFGKLTQMAWEPKLSEIV